MLSSKMMDDSGDAVDSPHTTDAQKTRRVAAPTSVPTHYRFRLSVTEGAQAGTEWTSSSPRCAIGSHPSNDVVLEDATVSRFHCEIQLDEGRARVVDLHSENGVMVEGVAVRDAYLRGN